MSFRSLFILMFALFIKQANAQCSSCLVSISGTNTTSYTVSAGQTFCIDSSGVYTGTVTLDGGTICNKGKFKPAAFTLNSGNFYNYSNVVVNTGFTVGSSSIFYCDKKSFVRINGAFAVSGGSYTNKGITNVYNTASYTAGTFSNTGIFNCQLLSGNTGSISNTGIINQN